MTLKAKKCYFAMQDCTYLGHRVGRGKIKLEQAKVAATQNKLVHFEQGVWGEVLRRKLL